MGIVGLQIEIEQIFNIVNVITSLKWCQLCSENLYNIASIMKN
jgi:hypothetical protein